jgi:hypothetical protein
MAGPHEKLRRVIREELVRMGVRRLTETKCPSCGASGAYHGLNAVECPNEMCHHFSPAMRTNAPASAGERIGSIIGIEWGHKDEAYVVLLDGPFADEQAAIAALDAVDWDDGDFFDSDEHEQLREFLEMERQRRDLTHVVDGDTNTVVPIDDYMQAVWA